MAYSHVAAQRPPSAPSAPTSSLPSVLDGEACAPRTPWHTPRHTHCAPTFARRTRHRTRAPSLSARKAGEDGSPRPQAALKVWGAHPKWPVPGPRLDPRHRPPSPETAPPSSGRPPSRPIASRPVHGKMDTRTATQLRAPGPGPASQPCPGSLCGSGRAGQPRAPAPSRARKAAFTPASPRTACGLLCALAARVSAPQKPVGPAIHAPPQRIPPLLSFLHVGYLGRMPRMPLAQRFRSFYPALVDTAWFLILGGYY